MKLTKQKSEIKSAGGKEMLFDAPNEKQKLFFLDTHRHIAYGGARGGGKSWAVRVKAALLCFRYPGIKVLIVRKSYPELINNHINYLRSMLSGAAVYNGSEKVFRFQNGSAIFFGYCACESDLDNFQGAEYDVIFIDEAGQLLEEWIKKLNACVRGANDFPKRTYYTLNPGGPSHGYFKRLFIDGHLQSGETPGDYSFIPALVTDNKALLRMQPDYIKNLEALPPKIRDAWAYGRWDVFDGQFFEEFRTTPDLSAVKNFNLTEKELMRQRRFTHVIEPFPMNRGAARGWSITRSYDFGYSKPFSCGWWATDFDGTIYRIAELYGCRKNANGADEANVGLKQSPDEQFMKIREIEESHPFLKGRKIDGVADPAIWDSSHGISIADTAAKYGIYFSPGDHKRLPGWMQCHYRLRFSEDGYPGMYVFSTCSSFIRTVPLLQYSKINPEDLDSAGEDHAADEWRYFCMSRPIVPREPSPGGELSPGGDAELFMKNPFDKTF